MLIVFSIFLDGDYDMVILNILYRWDSNSYIYMHSQKISHLSRYYFRWFSAPEVKAADHEHISFYRLFLGICPEKLY